MIPTKALTCALLLFSSAAAAQSASVPAPWNAAQSNGATVNDILRRTRRMLHAWLSTADRKTLLLPDLASRYCLEDPRGSRSWRPRHAQAPFATWWQPQVTAHHDARNDHAAIVGKPEFDLEGFEGVVANICHDAFVGSATTCAPYLKVVLRKLDRRCAFRTAGYLWPRFTSSDNQEK